MKPAFVLGGGVAGLAAAFGLCERGYRPILLEAHHWLGGRACSFRDKVTGAWFDNGPHVMLGCYAAMRALLRRIGSEDGFDRAPSLRLGYRAVGGGAAQLRLLRLPAPLAFAPALLRLPLGFGGRLRALRGLGAVLRPAPPQQTLQQWIERKHQRGTPTSYLWQPMSRAIMNAEPDAVAAELLLSTLREAFLGSAAAAAFWTPRLPWAQVFAPAAAALAQHGGTVRLSTPVRGLQCRDGVVAALQLGDDSMLAVPAGAPVVSALPWHALARLLPAPAPPFARLQGAPIVSAFVTLAEEVPPLPDDGPITCLVDGDPFHFVCRTPGAPARQFALLSGGNRAFDGMALAAMQQAARQQLQRHYPQFDAQCRAHVRISKEARATFVGAPAALALRPRPGPMPQGPRNLLLCGDWTDCGLPSTLEGAARSAAAMLAANA